MKGGKRLGALLLSAAILLELGACGKGGQAPEESRREKNKAVSGRKADLPEASPAQGGGQEDSVPALSAGEESRAEEQEEEMLELLVTVGEKEFSARLYDSETTRALLRSMPMTLAMSELNGNEKYFDLPLSLPAEASVPGNIRAGDLMLYGSNCLVLFYESFSSSYAYTPLGYLEDPAGLAEALGGGSVEVSFRTPVEPES